MFNESLFAIIFEIKSKPTNMFEQLTQLAHQYGNEVVVKTTLFQMNKMKQ